jgi:hypothetical protein
MKNTYQIKAIKKGMEQTYIRELEGDIGDELHIVCLKKVRQESQREIEAIIKANSFKEKYLPAIVFFGSLFLMFLIVANNRGWL